MSYLSQNNQFKNILKKWTTFRVLRYAIIKLKSEKV